MRTANLSQPISPLPNGPPVQGGSRRYVQTERILRNEAGSTAYGARTSTFRVRHPSTRLHGIIWVAFLPDVGEDATIPATWAVSLDAWGRTGSERYGARLHRGNSIIPGPFALPTTLPMSYEAVTAVDEWRGLVTIPAAGSGLATAGDLVVTAAWEPAPGATDISQQELEKLFQSCKVQPGNGITVFQTNPG